MTLPDEMWLPEYADELKPPLNTAGLESWLRDRGLGPAVAVVDGPEVPVDPGPLIVVSWTAGAGIDTEEGAVQRPGFQLRVIGPQGNRPAARDLAERVDRELVLRNRWPGIVGGRYVIVVRRAGGEPAHDRQDTANRAHYVCNYVADVEAR